MIRTSARKENVRGAELPGEEVSGTNAERSRSAPSRALSAGPRGSILRSPRSFESAEERAGRFTRILRSPQRTWQFGGETTVRLGNWISRRLGSVRGSYVWQKAVASYGRIFGGADYDDLLILSATRSGTTAMVDYLNCHPAIRCRGEILNPDYLCYGNARRMNRQRLKLHVESFYVKPKGVMAGAKFLTYQLDEMQLGLADLIEMLRRPKIVLLFREQMLEQYASLKLAEHTRVWHGNKPLASEAVWLDPGDFSAFAERERRMWRESLAALHGSDVHFVAYEQLHCQPDETMRSVFEFLGLESCSVESFVAKLHDRPLSKKLANYQEFLQLGIVAEAVLQLPFPGAAKRMQVGHWSYAVANRQPGAFLGPTSGMATGERVAVRSRSA